VSFIFSPLLIGLMAMDYYLGFQLIPEAGAGTLSPLWWLWAFHGFVNGAIWTFFIILVVSMFADVVEEHQAMTGSRSDGLVLVGRNLVTKLVGSVGVLFAGLMIQWAGFDDANTSELKEIAVYKLVTIKIAVSAILVPLGLLCLTRYSLSEDQHRSNLKSLGYNN
jgi:Na+/melibiose symporter-like transporter